MTNQDFTTKRSVLVSHRPDTKHMRSLKRPLIALALLLLSSVSAQETTQISLFTGADPGEGLDLQTGDGSQFLYALDVGGTGERLVGDALFTPAETTPGVTIEAAETLSEWGALNSFGPGLGDQRLAEILHSVRFSPAPGQVTVTLTGLEPGQLHKLQILFSEKCCDRGFDVLLGGESLLKGFSPRQFSGLRLNQGTLITHLFTPASTSVKITLSGAAADFPDASPILQALTLERFPNDPSLALPPLPTDLRLLRTPSAVQLQWTSNPSISYRVHYSETLNPSSWVTLTEPLAGTGAQLHFTDINPARRAKPTGFYRLSQSR